MVRIARDVCVHRCGTRSIGRDNCLWIQCSLDVTNAGCARIWIGHCDYGILLAGSCDGVATCVLDS